MRIPFILSMISLFIISCQQEIDFDSGSGGSGASGNTNGLLVKSVAVTGTDTMIMIYTYDLQSRLETMTTDGKSNGMVMHNYKKYERDATGRLSRILQKLDQTGAQSDTAIQIIHYPSASSMDFDYTVNTISLMGFSTMDSSIYTYTSGKMTSVSSYMSAPLLGLPPSLMSKYDYTYDGSGRVNVMKMYSAGNVPGGPLSPVANQTYTYTASLNSAFSSSSASQNYFLMGMPNTTNDAISKMQMDDLTTPANSFTLTTTYTLSGNKPVSATVTSTSGQVTKYTFYYQ